MCTRVTENRPVSSVARTPWINITFRTYLLFQLKLLLNIKKKPTGQYFKYYCVYSFSNFITNLLPTHYYNPSGTLFYTSNVIH
jgi:hypothetical protein